MRTKLTLTVLIGLILLIGDATRTSAQEFTQQGIRRARQVVPNTPINSCGAALDDQLSTTESPCFGGPRLTLHVAPGGSSYSAESASRWNYVAWGAVAGAAATTVALVIYSRSSDGEYLASPFALVPAIAGGALVGALIGLAIGR